MKKIKKEGKRKKENGKISMKENIKESKRKKIREK